MHAMVKPVIEAGDPRKPKPASAQQLPFPEGSLAKSAPHVPRLARVWAELVAAKAKSTALFEKPTNQICRCKRATLATWNH
jgi:hypothetical protein